MQPSYNQVSYKEFFENFSMEEILGKMPQSYNIGDEIDLIVYNNKKYVKLKEYKLNRFL